MADGDKFQVKLSARATAWVRYLSRQRQTTQSDLIREYFEERLFLFQVPTAIYQRLEARAIEVRQPLSSLIADILLEAALKFPAKGADILVPGHKTPDEPEGPVTRSHGFPDRKK